MKTKSLLIKTLATGKFLVALLGASLLLACGSGIKLNEPTVEDRTAQPVQFEQPAGPSGGAGGTQSGGALITRGGVEQVELKPVGPQTDAIQRVYFDYDSFAIKPEFQSVLEAQAKRLNQNKALKVALEGHTDSQGGREYNLALGQKRAEAVKRSLSLLGVSETQMEAISFGKEKPAADGDSEAVHAKNRRVEIVSK